MEPSFCVWPFYAALCFVCFMWGGLFYLMAQPWSPEEQAKRAKRTEQEKNASAIAGLFILLFFVSVSVWMLHMAWRMAFSAACS